MTLTNTESIRNPQSAIRDSDGWGMDLGLALGLGAAALALRLALLGKESLWGDEFDTWWVANTPTVADLMRHVVAIEPHPSLYFLLVRFFLKTVGQSGDVALRLPSALAGALTIPMFYFFLRCLDPGRRRVAVIGGALLALSPFHVWYSQEARAYSFQVLLEVGALAVLAWGMESERRRGRGGVLAALFVTLAMGVQYYSAFIWLAFGCTLAWAGWRGMLTRRQWIAPLGIMALGAIQPAWSVAQRLAGGWTKTFNVFLPERYGPDLLFHVARAQVLGPLWSPLPLWLQIAGLAAGLLLAGWGGWELWRRPREHALAGMLILCGLGCTLALPVAISFFKPIIFWGQRYLIIALPFSLTLIALGVAAAGMRSKGLGWGLLGVIVACQGIYLAYHYAHHVKHRWSAVGADLAKTTVRDEPVFVIPPRAAPLLARYMPPADRERIVGATDAAPLRQAWEQGGKRIAVVSYVDPRPWLAAAGLGKPAPPRVYEAYRPGQDLWVVEVPAGVVVSGMAKP